MTPRSLLTIGWVEEVALLDLAAVRLNAKVDTGARTCALHVVEPRVVAVDRGPDGREVEVLSFLLQPSRGRGARGLVGPFEARLLGRIPVRDSGGHTEVRPLITTRIGLGSRVFEARVTLTSRTEMVFPMLIGRTAIAGRYLVDPAGSFLLGGAPRPG